MKTILTAILLFSLVISGSSQIIGSKMKSFTENIRTEYDYYDIAMSDVLFYISGPISMKRELPKTKEVQNDDKARTKGRVAFENGKAYEYYEITQNATCKFESQNGDGTVLNMRFGQDEDEILKFQKAKGSGSDANFYYELVVGEEKEMNFLGLKWKLTSYPKVRLNVKEKRNTKVDVDKTKSRGIRMDGTEKKSLLQKRKKN